MIPRGSINQLREAKPLTRRRPSNQPREAKPFTRPTHQPREAKPFTRIVHLVDGTYELFRHFYGLRRFNKGVDRPYGAVVGVLGTVLSMIENRVKDFV